MIWGKEEEYGQAWEAYARELKDWLAQTSNSHWVLTEHSLFVLRLAEETESFILKLPYSAIRDQVSIYERVSTVHNKY